MNKLDITLSEEDKQNFEQEVQDARKPTIPNESLCKFIAYDLDITKSALTRAAEQNREPNVRDGLVLNLAIASYYKGKQEVKTIDYSDVKNIVLPFGKDLRVKASYFLNPTRLNFLNYKKPDTDELCIKLYHQLMERELGIPHGTMKMSGGALEPIIFYAYRYIDSYYKKEDLMPDKVTPKPGATRQISVVITAYNRTTKQLDLAPVEPIPLETAAAVYKKVQEMFPPKDSDLPF